MMKNIRGQSVSAITKLCVLTLALSLLCAAAPSHAALIKSNGTGIYEITGNDTWGLHGPTLDEEISSITIHDGASLTLAWTEDAQPVTHGNIYGNGNMEISGGGELIGNYSIENQPSIRAGYGIYGLSRIKDITLSSSSSGAQQGIFSFYALPYETNYWEYSEITSGRKTLTVNNVRQSSQSDMSSSFSIGSVYNKKVDISGGISLSLSASDFVTASLLSVGSASVSVDGGSEISITGSTVISDSYSVDEYGVGGSIMGTTVIALDDEFTKANTDTVYTQKGQSRITVKDVVIASEGTIGGYLGILPGVQVTGASDVMKANAEVESLYVEISGVTFGGTGSHSMSVLGGGYAITVLGNSDGSYRQYLGGAVSRITGASEILISGEGSFSGLLDGAVYCGGVVLGDNAVSTVGSAKLTLKDIDASSVHTAFSGVISGQGHRIEYQESCLDDPIITDYTESVLGDSVLVLDNVKADMSSNEVTVKYFDEIELANNTAVKLTTLDSEVKKITVTGAWGSEATALEFKQAVANAASITVDYSAASGVTGAYFTDDGMKFIVNGTGGGSSSQPSTDGGSGGGGGGCNAGLGSLALLAFAAFVPVAGKKLKK